MSVIYTDKFGNLHRRKKKRSKNTDRRRTRDNDVISYDVTMIIRISGSGDRIWYRIGSACVYSEKRPGRAAAETTSGDGLGRGRFWPRIWPFCAFTVTKRPGPSRGRARPFLHCKRGSIQITHSNNCSASSHDHLNLMPPLIKVNCVLTSISVIVSCNVALFACYHRISTCCYMVYA